MGEAPTTPTTIERVRQLVQNELAALFMADTKPGTPVPEVWASDASLSEDEPEYEIGICFAYGPSNAQAAALLSVPNLQDANPQAIAEFLFFGMAAYWSCWPGT